MGNLRPIGSEKLTGMEKINRMIEISRYNENTPKSINEDKSVEFSKIVQKENRKNENGIFNLNVRSLAAGYYLLKISSGNSVIQKKIIISE